VRRRGGKVTDEEGCLSLRNWYGPVERDQTVVVRAYDLQDRELRIEAHGFIARVLQHEIDHLDGIMFTDRMPDPVNDLRYVEPQDPNAPEDDATEAEGPHAAD
jgi:peptide deformylase